MCVFSVHNRGEGARGRAPTAAVSLSVLCLFDGTFCPEGKKMTDREQARKRITIKIFTLEKVGDSRQSMALPTTPQSQIEL